METIDPRMTQEVHRGEMPAKWSQLYYYDAVQEYSVV